MKNNSYEKYIDSLKEIKSFSVDAILVIKDLLERTRTEIEFTEEFSLSSDDLEKWLTENNEIIERLKITIEELNKFTFTFKD